MLRVLLKPLLIVCAMHSFATASSETSSNSSSDSTVSAVVKTPKFPAINVKRALMLPPEPPPITLDGDESSKKAAFAHKSDREKKLLAEIYEAYKRAFEPEEEVGFENPDGSPRIIMRAVIDMTTAQFEGDMVVLMINDKSGAPVKYKYNRKTGDLVAVSRVSLAWV